MPTKAAFKLSDSNQQQPTSRRSSKSKGSKQHSTSVAPVATAASASSPPEFAPSVDLVLGGDSTGGLWVWEPFRVPLGSSERELGPKVSWNGHSAEVWAVCLTPGPEDAEMAAAKVFTTGV